MITTFDRGETIQLASQRYLSRLQAARRKGDGWIRMLPDAISEHEKTFFTFFLFLFLLSLFLVHRILPSFLLFWLLR